MTAYLCAVDIEHVSAALDDGHEGDEDEWQQLQHGTDLPHLQCLEERIFDSKLWQNELEFTELGSSDTKVKQNQHIWDLSKRVIPRSKG